MRALERINKRRDEGEPYAKLAAIKRLGHARCVRLVPAMEMHSPHDRVSTTVKDGKEERLY